MDSSENDTGTTFLDGLTMGGWAVGRAALGTLPCSFQLSIPRCIQDLNVKIKTIKT